MSSRAAVTVNRAPEEVQRLWRAPEHQSSLTGAKVEFRPAPGDRGTEIHVETDDGSLDLAKIKDELRRFKQRVETGEVPRSDGTPAGESVESKLKQRPAQPLSADELEKVGV